MGVERHIQAKREKAFIETGALIASKFFTTTKIK